MPSSVRTAVGLMYAGTGYALVYAIGVIVVAGNVIKNHPVAAAVQVSSGRTSLAGVVALTIFLSVIEIAIWLGIAQACRRGKNWARVTGTVLFGFHTLGTLGILGDTNPGIGPAKVLTVISWLIACATVVALWQRRSNPFFSARTSISR